MVWGVAPNHIEGVILNRYANLQHHYNEYHYHLHTIFLTTSLSPEEKILFQGFHIQLSRYGRTDRNKNNLSYRRNRCHFVPTDSLFRIVLRKMLHDCFFCVVLFVPTIIILSCLSVKKHRILL